MSYSAVIAKLVNVRAHPNADRVALATVCGNQVVVGLNARESDLGVFFPDDGVLSIDMAHANNLFNDGSLNKDDTKTGYFSNPPRVRAQNFRGEKSYGFWIELESLTWTEVDLSTLEEGFQFTELNGHEVCRKYINPATLRAAHGSAKAKAKARVAKRFAALKEHFDTKQLRQEIGSIPEGSVLYLTEKVHGTSGRTGNVIAERKLIEPPLTTYTDLKGLQGVLKVIPRPFGRPIRQATKFLVNTFFLCIGAVVGFINRVFPLRPGYQVISGTRRVVLDPKQEIEQGWYSGKKFRVQVHKMFEQLNIPKGLTFYYEIAGFDETGSPIMSPQSIEKIDDKKLLKDLRRLYGDTMTYSYGCDPLGDKKYRVFVYRATLTSEDGFEVELPWAKVKDLCKKLGLEHVQEVTPPIEYNLQGLFNGESEYWGDKSWTELLLEKVQNHLDEPSGIDKRHIIEGVCTRYEAPDGSISILKDKSFGFKLLEGIIKSNPDTVDIEEVESVPTEDTEVPDAGTE